jgi:hypothetical protein
MASILVILYVPKFLKTLAPKQINLESRNFSLPELFPSHRILYPSLHSALYAVCLQEA